MSRPERRSFRAQALYQRRSDRRQRHLRVQRRAREVPERRELRCADDDGEAVHEADHARVGHQPDELAESRRAARQLDDARHENRGEQVLGAVARDQRCEHHRGRARGAADDAGLRAESGGGQSHERRGVQPADGRHPGDERERERLRDHRQGDGDTREDLPEEGGGRRRRVGHLRGRRACRDGARRPRDLSPTWRFRPPERIGRTWPEGPEGASEGRARGGAAEAATRARARACA